MGIASSNTCDKCREANPTKDSIYHRLFDCPWYLIHRNVLTSRMPEDLLFDSLSNDRKFGVLFGLMGVEDKEERKQVSNAVHDFLIYSGLTSVVIMADEETEALSPSIAAESVPRILDHLKD